ncbi:MAG: UDP-N-acetyl-D-glucosamine dehydrogenase, partial [Solirubrobacterales bacterium]|nr:UDP-N-acetyl-D-glucosamine dehydrogenase [Solirubrobacterales bacterium]
ADVSYHDEHVPTLEPEGLESVELGPAVADADAVAIITAHPGIDYEALFEAARLVVDFRGVSRGSEAANVVRL